MDGKDANYHRIVCVCKPTSKVINHNEPLPIVRHSISLDKIKINNSTKVIIGLNLSDFRLCALVITELARSTHSMKDFYWRRLKSIVVFPITVS